MPRAEIRCCVRVMCSCDAKADQGADEGGRAHQRRGQEPPAGNEPCSSSSSSSCWELGIGIVHTNNLQAIHSSLQSLTNVFFFSFLSSLLQKYRLHTRRASSDVGGGDHLAAAAVGGLWSSSGAAEQQYATSQHSTSQSQSGSPQGPLQLTTVSSRAMSATAGDSCDGDGDEAEGGGRSESYGWEMQQQQQQQHGTKASSSS